MEALETLLFLQLPDATTASANRQEQHSLMRKYQPAPQRDRESHLHKHSPISEPSQFLVVDDQRPGDLKASIVGPL